MKELSQENNREKSFEGSFLSENYKKIFQFDSNFVKKKKYKYSRKDSVLKRIVGFQSKEEEYFYEKNFNSDNKTENKEKKNNDSEFKLNKCEKLKEKIMNIHRKNNLSLNFSKNSNKNLSDENKEIIKFYHQKKSKEEISSQINKKLFKFLYNKKKNEINNEKFLDLNKKIFKNNENESRKIKTISNGRRKNYSYYFKKDNTEKFKINDLFSNPKLNEFSQNLQKIDKIKNTSKKEEKQIFRNFDKIHNKLSKLNEKLSDFQENLDKKILKNLKT